MEKIYYFTLVVQFLKLNVQRTINHVNECLPSGHKCLSRIMPYFNIITKHKERRFGETCTDIYKIVTK